MTNIYRYAAFISYSSRDAAFARRLHRVLERYTIPKSLGSFDLIGGGTRNRIYPVFRDREELAAGHLGEVIEASLRASASLVVVCSPSAAASPWVNKEIEYFASLGRADKIFAIISDRAPAKGELGEDVTNLFFPAALRGDALSGSGLQPLAGDARRGKDRFRHAWLKIVAGMIGVSPGQIINRDKRRRVQRQLSLSFGVAAAALALTLAAVYVDAYNWRSDMVAHAAEASAHGDSIEAINFATAGLPGPGDIVRVTRSDAEAVAARSGALVPIVDEVGSVFAAKFARGGALLVASDEDNNGYLYDLRRAASRTSLGQGMELDISSDGRFLASLHIPDTDSELRDLVEGGQPQVFHMQVYRGFSPDGRFFVGNYPDHSVVWDIRHRVELVSLQDVSSVWFSADSRFFLAASHGGKYWLVDLSNPRVAISLGALANANFSEDGRFLLTTDKRHLFVLRDLRASGRTVSLGPLKSAEFAGQAHFVITESLEGERWNIRDPATGAVVWSLDSRQPRDITPDGRFAILSTRHANEELTSLALVDRSSGRELSFGKEAEAAFSPDGHFLVSQKSGGVNSLLHDLYGRRAPVSLGDLVLSGGFRFSQDSHFLLTHYRDDFASVRSLRAPSQALSLGRISQIETSVRPTFSPEGDVILTVEPNTKIGGTAVVRDLNSLPALPVAARAFSCSHNAIAPFSEAQRQTSGTSQGLRGRPWNPCDWRGLGAVLPNPSSGDGWFEGLRQWSRLIAIRYFHGRDWRCDETTSGASPALKRARVSRCSMLAW